MYPFSAKALCAALLAPLSLAGSLAGCLAEEDPPLAAEEDQTSARRAASGAGPGALFIDNQTVDDEWFQRTFCARRHDVQSCLLNQTAALTKNEVVEGTIKFSICADVGTVLFGHAINNQPWQTVTVLEGMCASYEWTSFCPIPGSCFNLAHYAVNDVQAGERFHLAVSIDN